MKINIPNQITIGRLVLAGVFFALLSWFNPAKLDEQRWLLNVCFWVFLIATLTDFLDGFIARLMKAETSFGRIVDPVVDKVLVCGAFVLFASHNYHVGDAAKNVTGVQAWMVVVILVRELLVSAVRTHIEAQGQDFGASWVGKIKMVVQSTTVCIILGQLAWDLKAWEPIRLAAIWITVLVTAASAVSYVHRARDFLLSQAALHGTPATGKDTAATSPTNDDEARS
jgi:CDP-diacylglycerol--glycerol-3-phosphate 3-phosphatidyltransferase